MQLPVTFKKWKVDWSPFVFLISFSLLSHIAACLFLCLNIYLACPLLYLDLCLDLWSWTCSLLYHFAACPLMGLDWCLVTLDQIFSCTILLLFPCHTRIVKLWFLLYHHGLALLMFHIAALFFCWLPFAVCWTAAPSFCYLPFTVPRLLSHDCYSVTFALWMFCIATPCFCWLPFAVA